MNRFLVAVVLVCIPGLSLAQGFACGSETTQMGGGGAIACIPRDQPQDFSDPVPAAPLGPEWETRWGAIALGGGGFGAANDVDSRRKAEKLALKECRDTGGGERCKISITYYNQCAASATGLSVAATYSAPEKSEAEHNALKDCNSRDQNCEVFYSACSYPARVQ